MSIESGASTASVRANAAISYTWSHLDVYSVLPAARTVGATVAAAVPGLRQLLHAVRPPTARTADESTRRVQLLRDVSGCAHAGEMLAIMGSSGAGKTTLLNTLAFRSAGDIRIGDGSRRSANGRPLDADQLRPHCAYVEQLDIFIGTLTAVEHLRYQAQLRLDRGWSAQRKSDRVDAVMAELSLVRCAHTLIGTPGRTKGLSGGERKRLSFATEALNNPQLLLCDEPTSGLDSFMSLSVVQVLRRLAGRGKTVLLTIHQPSSDLAAMFDRLLLMAAGRVAFSGTPAEALAFFASVGSPCPTHFNPTDHFVQVLGVRPGCEADDRQRVEAVCDGFAGSAAGRALLCEAVGGVGGDGSMVTVPLSDAEAAQIRRQLRAYRASWLQQFVVLYKRAGMSVLKEPVLIQVRLVATVIVSLLIGGIYWQQPATADGVMNMNGAMYLILTTVTFQNIFSVIDVFCLEMPVFVRESRGHLYRTDAYFLAKSLAELPLFVLTPCVCMAIVYPMIGYHGTPAAAAAAVGLVVLVANVATSFSYLASCASPSIAVALSVAPPATVPIMLFSGFFLNMRSVPDALAWCPYVSWLRYGFEGWMIAQWRDYGPGSIECVGAPGGCLTSGAMVLGYFDFHEDHLWLDFVGLLALFAGLRLAAYVALVLRSASKE